MRCPKGAGLACVLSEKTERGALVFTAFDPQAGRGGEVFRIDEPTAASNIWEVVPNPDSPSRISYPDAPEDGRPSPASAIRTRSRCVASTRMLSPSIV